MATYAKLVFRNSIPVFVNEFMPKLLNSGRLHKFGQILIDGIIVGISFWVALMVRFDFQVPSEYGRQFFLFLPGLVFIYLGSNLIWHIYKLVWHFIGLRDLGKIAQSVAFSAVVCFGFNLLFPHDPSVGRVPFGVILSQPFLAYAGWVGVRLVRRMIYEWDARQKELGEIKPSRKRLVLVGAGQAGLSVLQDLRKRTGFEIVGFLDDKPHLHGRVIDGCPVLGSTEEVHSIVEKYSIKEVTLCMPSASRLTLQRIVSRCQSLSVKTTTVPTLSEILLGKVALSRLRPVKMEDLLGRKSITYPGNGSDKDLINTYRGSRILVTGAGGSIGSELNRQLREFNPSQLILLDKDENSLYETQLEICSVRDTSGDQRQFS
jgi:FlaA1/EpsC-like NDP-sugar epimerase